MMLVPLVYLPTEVIFIDDNVEFLYNLGICLDAELHTYTFFSDTERALERIESSKNTIPALDILSNARTVGAGQVEIQYSFSRFNQEVANKIRFDMISVVVADYSMPSQNGIEFLKSLPTHKGIKRILLTGEADEKIAVEAFNQRAIDFYIKKTDADCITTLRSAIEELTRKFFIEKSAPAKALLTNNTSLLPNHFEKFRNYFQKLIKEHHIVEYYCVEYSFRYLLLKSNGETYSLYIQTQSMADMLYEEIKELPEEEFSLELKTAVRHYHKILCTPFGNLPSLPLKERANYYKSCVFLDAEEGLLVALQKETLVNDPIFAFTEKKLIHTSYYL